MPSKQTVAFEDVLVNVRKFARAARTAETLRDQASNGLGCAAWFELLDKEIIRLRLIPKPWRGAVDRAVEDAGPALQESYTVLEKSGAVMVTDKETAEAVKSPGDLLMKSSEAHKYYFTKSGWVKK